jgi:decaprenylphospho-beta-D-ribofuranose 2-oxidase
MLSKNKAFSNFSNAKQTMSNCFRPDNESQLVSLFANTKADRILARGNGTSYGDCCLNDRGVVIDTSRLRHLLSFDETTGVLICQGSVSFADLFLVSPNYIPPVIPGTLSATVAGGIANDVHGKNNHHEGNFGQHIQWINLQLGKQSLHCSQKENSGLFYATIAGLGLTGVIKRVAITMRKASHFVTVQTEKHFALATLLQRMQEGGCQYDYQVAWLDFLNKPRAILSLAKHSKPINSLPTPRLTVPKLPIRLVNPWIIKQFNRYYFKTQQTIQQTLPLSRYNNPLDTILQWNRLYGKNGLLQFQSNFAADNAEATIEHLLAIMRSKKATPTLAVLKYLTKPGIGLLSFTQPGFTLAIDFINNQRAQEAIVQMNEWITKIGGKIYLAKDLLLTKEQFKQQYPKYEQFSKLLSEYKTMMHSDLSDRLGIT